VRHIAACSQNALDFHRDLYGYQPAEEVAVFLEDWSDFGHGGANTVPVNFVTYGVAPFNYVYETVPAIDRMFWMANHEMAHIATMDQAAGRDLRWRALFGGKVAPIAGAPESIFYNYLTNPRWNAPRWYHEGIAVFLESWMAGGLGRVLGGYDEMVFRSMVRDDALFYDVVGLESEGTTVDFQVGVNSYLYGTRFMSYLAYRHGPEKVIEWTARRPGSRAYFAAQFERVFDAPLAVEWSRWIEFERDWQRSNLAAIQEQPTTPVLPLSEARFGSVSRPHLDRQRGAVYLAVRYPGQLAHLARLDLDSGRLEKLANVEGAALFYVTSLAFDPERRLLYFTTDNYGWRDLHVFDLERGSSRRLQKDLRAGDLVWDRSRDALWGVRHVHGISTLVRIDAPYDFWDQVFSWPYGEDLYDIDVSPDGRWLTGALARADGTQQLVRIDLSAVGPETAPGEAVEVLFDFGHTAPSNFTFSEDGRFLYGTSYYSGVSNVYRWDFEAADMSILSNVDTGLFRPVPLGDGRLLAFRYTGQGFVPVEIEDRALETVSAIRFLGTAIADRHPIVREWKAGSPTTVEAPSASERRDYPSARRLRFETAYPVVQGYKDSAALGYRAGLSDRLGLSSVELTASYSPEDDELEDSERLHVDLALRHWGWTVRGRYNAADFYDLFGPTRTSRRGYSLGFSWERTLLYDEPRKLSLRTSLTGYGDLETLPEFQNVDAASDKLLQASIGLDYEMVWKSLGAVDEERGTRWRLQAVSNTPERGGTSPRLSLDWARGFLTPIDHSSIWFRTSAGRAFGDRGDPFAQFFFGGFGNNWVDHLDEKRYRRQYSFPGVEIDELGGRDYVKGMVEWTLPPLRFRRAGVPSFYLNWLRPALFAGALRTDLGSSALRRTTYDLGAQVDLRLVFFSNLNATLSLGYARAWQDGGPSSDEVLVSLKIL
jgi:hypothetical protein